MICLKFEILIIDTLIFADVSIFMQEISIFYPQWTFTQSNSLRASFRDLLIPFTVLVRNKVNEKVSFTDHASGFWLPDCFQLAINQKSDNDVTFSGHDIITKVF